MLFSVDRLDSGSLILVTGATGLIGSSVTTLLLDRGFKVRAATRSLEKQKPFQQLLEDRYGKDSIELVEVKDYTKVEAWDTTLKGVQGVIHLATDTSFSPKYDVVISSVKAMTTTFLDATAKAPNVKSVVMTSSRTAVFVPIFGDDINATVNDWADDLVNRAQTIKEDDLSAPVLIYAASKVIAEHVAWDFMKQKTPHFAVKTVLPSFVAGPVANPTPGVYLTHSMLNELFLGAAGGRAVGLMSPASRFVDVRDVAFVHVAALVETNLDGQRLWAAPHKFTANEILAVWRDAFPERKLVPDFKFEKQPDINIDDEQSTALVKAFKGRDWHSFKETVLCNVQAVL